MFNSIGFNSIKTKLIPTFFGFVFVIISSRIVGPNKIGEFVIYLILYNLLKLICEGGFSLVLSDKKYLTIHHLYATNLHYVTIGIIGCIVIGLINVAEFSLNIVVIQLSLISFCIHTYYQNDLKMKLKYGQLSTITFYSTLIAVSISIVLIIITKNEIILYLRYFLLEFVMLLLVVKRNQIKYKFGKFKRLLILYPKSLNFLLQGLAESLVEFFLVRSIHSTVGSGTVGFFNRSNQFVDAGIKSPIQGFRAAYIGLVTSRNGNFIKEIVVVFSFLILSTFLISYISLNGEEVIIFTLGKDWLSLLDWLKYAIIVGWAFVFEQLASTNMYLIKKHRFILALSFVIKAPIIFLIYKGFDLNSWTTWSFIYLFLALIYFISTTIYTINEYRSSNNMDA